MSRPIIGKLRFWERSWVRAKARHTPQNIAIIAISEHVDDAKKSMIEVSLAFSTPAIQTVFWLPQHDMTAFIDEVANAKARYFIAIDRKLTKNQKRALRYLEVEFTELNLEDVQSQSTLELDPFDDKIRKIKEQRTAIYAHKPRGAELGVILRAFAETKRRYPDLVLLLTGVTLERIKEIGFELLVANITDGREKIKLCDIIYDADKARRNSWVAAANVSLIAGRDKHLDDTIRHSLSLGSAVVVLGAPQTPSPVHDELESRGAIWSVKRPQGLAPALAQALEPEKTALTVMQAMDYFHGRATELQDKIDDLLARAS